MGIREMKSQNMSGSLRWVTCKEIASMIMVVSMRLLRQSHGKSHAYRRPLFVLVLTIIWVVTGFLFWVWMKLGKRMGSLMKKKMIV